MMEADLTLILAHSLLLNDNKNSIQGKNRSSRSCYGYEVTNEVRNYIFGIDIEHVPNNEIALFIFGIRGEGHVDRQIIDNISYYEKIKIPRYRSFEVNADRRSEIGFASTFIGGALVLKRISTLTFLEETLL